MKNGDKGYDECNCDGFHFVMVALAMGVKRGRRDGR